MAKIRMRGYHGTTVEAAKDIVKTQEVWDSTENNEWLGKGAYFFAYPRHATLWIKHENKLPGDIVEAQLEFDEQQWLDLDDPAQMDKMNHDLVALYRKISPQITIMLPKDPKELWKVWCWACDTYRGLHKEVGIISYTFPQKKFSPASGYHSNERQICVSDHSIIKSLAIYDGPK